MHDVSFVTHNTIWIPKSPFAARAFWIASSPPLKVEWRFRDVMTIDAKSGVTIRQQSRIDLSKYFQNELGVSILLVQLKKKKSWAYWFKPHILCVFRVKQFHQLKYVLPQRKKKKKKENLSKDFQKVPGLSFTHAFEFARVTSKSKKFRVAKNLEFSLWILLQKRFGYRGFQATISKTTFWGVATFRKKCDFINHA